MRNLLASFQFDMLKISFECRAEKVIRSSSRICHNIS